MKIDTKYLKYIRLIIALIVVCVGVVFLLIPFIPLGYVLIFAGMFLLVPYVPIFKKWIDYFKKKDKKNRIGKAEQRLDRSENWMYEKFSDSGTEEGERLKK